MGSFRIPGPLGFYTSGGVEDGTLARSWSFPPGTTGGVTTPATLLITQRFEVRVTLAPSGGLHFKKPSEYSGPMRQNNATLLSQVTSFEPNGGRVADNLRAFEAHYVANASRYQAVAVKTSLPTELVAALHWREASGDFTKLMSNGQPLDKKSTIVPYDGPYKTWEESALAPLTSRANLISIVELDKDMNDLVALATFAELWNGKGYFNRGVPSPYVFSGTNVYTSGKFVADGKYDANAVDAQAGVVAMLVKLRGTPEQR